MVAAGAADRWFTHAFRQKAPEVVEALCHQLTHSNAEGYAECCEALAAADLRSEVGQIRVPTLIIAGESDPVTTVADAHFYISRSPRRRWWWFPPHICPASSRRGPLARRCWLFCRRAIVDDKTRYQQGMNVRRKVLGDAHVERTLHNLTPLNDEFQDFITRYAWGETGPDRGWITIPAA